MQAFSIYREAAANKDDRDMPMSIIVSLTVTTKRFWKFVIDSLLDILAPLLPMTSFIIESQLGKGVLNFFSLLIFLTDD